MPVGGTYGVPSGVGSIEGHSVGVGVSVGTIVGPGDGVTGPGVVVPGCGVIFGSEPALCSDALISRPASCEGVGDISSPGSGDVEGSCEGVTDTGLFRLFTTIDTITFPSPARLSGEEEMKRLPAGSSGLGMDVMMGSDFVFCPESAAKLSIYALSMLTDSTENTTTIDVSNAINILNTELFFNFASYPR